jgi:hypothetical protein
MILQLYRRKQDLDLLGQMRNLAEAIFLKNIRNFLF